MKKKQTIIKELRAELRYWQEQSRMEARWLKASREKAKKIGARMRAAQRSPG